MPTYEYRCPRGHVFDVFQKMSDEPGATCPECGESSARVLSGGAGFLFKGEGFYITDYRSADYKKKAEAERDGAPAKADKGSDKDRGGAAPAKAGESPSSGGGSGSSAPDKEG